MWAILATDLCEDSWGHSIRKDHQKQNLKRSCANVDEFQMLEASDGFLWGCFLYCYNRLMWPVLQVDSLRCRYEADQVKHWARSPNSWKDELSNLIDLCSKQLGAYLHLTQGMKSTLWAKPGPFMCDLIMWLLFASQVWTWIWEWHQTQLNPPWEISRGWQMFHSVTRLTTISSTSDECIILHVHKQK